MLLKIIGSICLGVVLGYLVMFFIKRLKEYTIKSLLSIAIIVSGGFLIKGFFEEIILSYYFIGIAIGFFFNAIITYIVTRDTSTILYSKKYKLKNFNRD